MRRPGSLFPALLVTASALLTSSCPDEDTGASDISLDSIADVAFDVGFDITTVPDTSEVDDAADADADAEVVETCTVAGGFGCPCTTAGDCLDGQCIEGVDGSVCTRACIDQCPAGYDCLTTGVGGADPVTICVPRHTRLCRPCVIPSDCRNPLDPSPAACVPAADPSEGSFCATSCAETPCPDGYDCEDVAVGEGTSRLCLPSDDTCECRPAWADLLLTTNCQTINDFGECDGARTCAAAGLTACSAATPATEACNLVDDDCDGTTDNVAAVACDNTNGLLAQRRPHLQRARARGRAVQRRRRRLRRQHRRGLGQLPAVGLQRERGRLHRDRRAELPRGPVRLHHAQAVRPLHLRRRRRRRRGVRLGLRRRLDLHRRRALRRGLGRLRARHRRRRRLRGRERLRQRPLPERLLLRRRRLLQPA